MASEVTCGKCKQKVMADDAGRVMMHTIIVSSTVRMSPGSPGITRDRAEVCSGSARGAKPKSATSNPYGLRVRRK